MLYPVTVKCWTFWRIYPMTYELTNEKRERSYRHTICKRKWRYGVNDEWTTSMWEMWDRLWQTRFSLCIHKFFILYFYFSILLLFCHKFYIVNNFLIYFRLPIFLSQFLNAQQFLILFLFFYFASFLS